jgi:hypothetical protein
MKMANIDVIEVAPKKGDKPFTPYLHIDLSEHSSDSEGHILLSPRLMTEKEIDEAIESLIKKLEKARKAAKSKLKRVKESAK